MIEFKRSKKSRSKNALFNPYKNGISEYDMAYLSSRKVLKNKTFLDERYAICLLYTSDAADEV